MRRSGIQRSQQAIDIPTRKAEAISTVLNSKPSNLQFSNEEVHRAVYEVPRHSHCEDERDNRAKRRESAGIDCVALPTSVEAREMNRQTIDTHDQLIYQSVRLDEACLGMG